jgi:outer membrane protein assembly factor BamB
MKQIAIGLLIFAVPAFGGDWLQWRGPELNGTCDANNLPASWSVESGENVAWSCDLPGLGSSTPIVVGDHIFLTTHSDDDRLDAICIDRKAGRISWKKKMGSGKKALRGNTMASPSAVSDGKTVWFLFGQGTLAAMSMEGTELWKRELREDHGELSPKFGFSSSPLLHEGKLYIPLLYLPKGEQKAPNPGNCLIAIDAVTGETLWTVERKTKAIKESHDSYITPIIAKNGLVVTGADVATCHDPETGKEKWRYDFAKGDHKTNWRIISGPVAAGDLVVSAYPRGRTLVALKPDGSKRWEYEGRIPDVCTPAYEDGLLYVLDGAKRYLTCIDARNGSEIWQEKIPSDKGFFGSPLVADGKVYMINHNAEVFVYAAGRNATRINRIPMSGKNSFASIVAVDDTLYIRTPDKLVCARAK